MSAAGEVDVIVLGAGPAGSTAALRLAQLGYRVVLCDKQDMPRAQVGEALTPGVAHTLDALGARDILARTPHLPGLRTRRIWRSQEVELLEGTAHTMVDRARFDAALVDLARQRGVSCRIGATVREIRRMNDTWECNIESRSGVQRCRARQLLDARGRSATRCVHSIAPRLLATWVDVAAAGLVDEIRLEATPRAWFWGAPLPGGGCRLMAFCDPSDPELHALGREGWFRSSLAGTRLFADCVPALERCGEMRSCAATPCVAFEIWRDGLLKLGDAAFALDPLSSTGVEKAMRFSLQAGLALNTALSEPSEAELARQFLDDRVSQAVAEHTVWTQQAYSRAWPGSEYPFWRARGRPAEDLPAPSGKGRPRAIADADAVPATAQAAAEFLRAALARPIRLSPQIEFVETACAVGDRIRRCPAVRHPGLQRPAAFVQGVALQPLLASMVAAASLSQWIELCSRQISPTTSLGIAAWAAQCGLIVSVNAAPTG